MPYIHSSARQRVIETTCNPMEFPDIQTAGELNFILTALVDEYLDKSGGVSYDKINEVIGVLECAKLELYRRVAAPYEDQKREQNGDVYTCLD